MTDINLISDPVVDPPEIPARKVFSKIGFILLIIFIISLVLQGILLELFSFVEEGQDEPPWATWIITVAPFYIIAVPVGLMLFKRIPSESIQSNKLERKKFILYLIMCLPLMYIGSVIGTVLASIISGGNATNGLETYIYSASLLDIIDIVILAPIIEEYIFRKQIIDRVKKYGEKTAIFFSASVFALFHMNLYQLFYTFGLGLILAYVYIRTGRLRYSIWLHMAINFMGSVIPLWIISQVDMETLQQLDAMSDEMAVLAYGDLMPGILLFGAYLILLVSVSITGLVLLIRKRKEFIFEPTTAELPQNQRMKSMYLNAGMIWYILICLCMTALVLMI